MGIDSESDYEKIITEIEELKETISSSKKAEILTIELIKWC